MKREQTFQQGWIGFAGCCDAYPLLVGFLRGLLGER
jgi:hypothetical protein